MDKKYYKPTEEKFQELQKEKSRFQRLLSEKPKQSKVIQQRRITKHAVILAIAIFLLISENLSFRRLSILMASKYQIKMSATAWEKQNKWRIYWIFMQISCLGLHPTKFICIQI